MELHILHNGDQTGPYTVSQLRLLVASRKFSETDFCWHEGMAQWTTLGEFLNSPAARAYRPRPKPVTHESQKQRQVPGSAIGSLVCGLIPLGLCGIPGAVLGVIGVIAAHVALHQIKHSLGYLHGRRLAIAAMVLNYVWIGVAALVLVFQVNVSMARMKQLGEEKRSIEKVKERAAALHAACMAYSRDHDGALPRSLEQLVPKYVSDRAALAFGSESHFFQSPCVFHYYGDTLTGIRTEWPLLSSPPSKLTFKVITITVGGEIIVESLLSKKGR